MLGFRDKDKEFEDLLKKITNENYNVDLAKLSDKKTFDSAKGTYFDEKVSGNKSTRDKSLKRLLKSPAIMAGSLKESNTTWLSSAPNELCDRLKLLLQEKQAGSNYDIINEEIVAIADKLLECKCIPTKQHKFFLIKCLN